MYTGKTSDIAVLIFVLNKWETLILAWTGNCSILVVQIQDAKPMLLKEPDSVLF